MSNLYVSYKTDAFSRILSIGHVLLFLGFFPLDMF